MTNTRSQVRQMMLRLAQLRGTAKTYCPSEVARAVQPQQWRELMPIVREVAGELADRGVICIEQAGARIDLQQVRGPIRLRHCSSDQLD